MISTYLEKLHYFEYFEKRNHFSFILSLVRKDKTKTLLDVTLVKIYINGFSKK